MKIHKYARIWLLVTIVLICFVATVSAGEIVCWGMEYYGMLSYPADLDFVAVAAGWYHNIALKADGSIVGWGDNGHGQINCPAGNDFVQIAAGSGYSIALKSDGSIAGWGVSTYGSAQITPTGNNFVMIAAGAWHGLALKSDGSIVGWGRNYSGQINCPSGNDYVAISASLSHSLALKADGSIVGWGGNDYGQINCPAGNDFVAVRAASMHSLALKSDGSLVAWGSNDYGQLNCPAGNDFVAIDTGYWHNLALRADGSIVGWGDDDYGETVCPSGNDYVGIATGSNHSVALKKVQTRTAFTYQGRLMDDDSPAEGLYDLQFGLYNSENIQEGDILEKEGIDIADGYFTTELDFGTDVFDGYARWLGIAIRTSTSSDPNDYIALNPQQELIPTPYAQTSNTALSLKAKGGSTPEVFVDHAGNVGIGTTTPVTKLDIAGNVLMSGSNLEVRNPTGGAALKVRGDDGLGTTRAEVVLDRTDDYRGGGVRIMASQEASDTQWFAGVPYSGGGYSIGRHATGPEYKSNSDLFITTAGNVGIGTISPVGKLDVNGTIYQRGGLLHADYVFEPDYPLESIEEHAAFMYANKHLPAIPAKQVDNTGQEVIEVGAHRKGIVEELEKAHIYIEQLHQHNKELQKELERFKSEFERFKEESHEDK